MSINNRIANRRDDIIGELIRNNFTDTYRLFLEFLDLEVQRLRKLNDEEESEIKIYRNQGGIREIKRIVSDLTVLAKPSNRPGGYGG